MRVVGIGRTDFGNSAAWYLAALRGCGVDTELFVDRPHTFCYSHQGTRIPHRPSQVEALLEGADIIWMVQANLPEWMGGFRHPPGYRIRNGIPERPDLLEIATAVRKRWLPILKHKPVVANVGCSYYRCGSEYYQEAWEGAIDAFVMHEGDHLRLVPGQTERLIPPPIPIFPRTYPRKTVGKRLIVGHFPSNAYSKGTGEIYQVMTALEARYPDRIEFRHSCIPDCVTGVQTVLWPQHLDRMNECDVIIDQIQNTFEGKPFGAWCSCATEAAALGKVTIANDLWVDDYIVEYGQEPGLTVCNDHEELAGAIVELMMMEPADVERVQDETREWVEELHSLEATGQRVLTEVLEPLMGVTA